MIVGQAVKVGSRLGLPPSPSNAYHARLYVLTDLPFQGYFSSGAGYLDLVAVADA